MKIPKKISPDRIKNAIIEIRYTSKTPFEILLGLIYKALDNSYNYVNRPSPTFAGQQVFEKSGIQIGFGFQPIFITKNILIQLQPNSISFNCLNNYISWSNYFPEIEKFLMQIIATNEIEVFNRLGIRYISEYPNIDLQSCTKFHFSFGMTEVVSKTYSFKSEFEYNGNKVVLNLHNKLPVLKNISTASDSEIQEISLIDIDIIKSDISYISTDYQSFLNDLNQLHNFENEIFFSILSDSFLATLNPIY